MKLHQKVTFFTLPFFLIWIWACNSDSTESLPTHEMLNPLVSNGRWSELHDSINKGDAKQTQKLLKKGILVNIVSARESDFSCTPLYLASQKGDLPIMILLLEHGANVDLGKSTGETPLHAAIQAGNRAAVELLLQRGANMETESFYTEKPLVMAEKLGREDIIDVLKKAKSKEQTSRNP